MPGQVAQLLETRGQSFLIAELGGRLPQGLDLLALLRHPLREQRRGGTQQALAHLGGQGQRPHIDRVGQQMRGVFKPQAILDQAGFACLSDEFLKELGEAFDADAFAKVSAAGVVRQSSADGPTEKPAKRHIGAGAFDDLAIGQFVMKAQEQDLEHAYRINGRPPLAQRIRFGQARPKAFRNQCKRPLCASNGRSARCAQRPTDRNRTARALDQASTPSSSPRRQIRPQAEESPFDSPPSR